MKRLILSFVLLSFALPVFSEMHNQNLGKMEKLLLEQFPIRASSEFNKDCMSVILKLKVESNYRCYLLESEDPNAFIFESGRIYISIGMLKLFRNQDQWASIVAHEIAHIELSHHKERLKKIKKPGFFFTKSRLKKLIKKQEKEADDWSYKQLKLRGLDPNQVAHLIQRLSETNLSSSDFHINYSSRQKNLKLGVEHKDKILIEKIQNVYLTGD